MTLMGPLLPSTLTLECQRAPHPLLDKLREANVTYRWGFPACLIATKDGHSATLQFPEDLEKFCQDMHIDPLDLPGWQEHLPVLTPFPEQQWHTASKKRRSGTPGSSHKNE